MFNITLNVIENGLQSLVLLFFFFLRNWMLQLCSIWRLTHLEWVANTQLLIRG